MAKPSPPVSRLAEAKKETALALAYALAHQMDSRSESRSSSMPESKKPIKFLGTCSRRWPHQFTRAARGVAVAPECLPRPLCRPAMAFSEGNKFLHVTILPLPWPHKSNCSGDGKVQHRHPFHARDLKMAGHECQAKSGGDESQCPIIVVGPIHNIRPHAQGSERIRHI